MSYQVGDAARITGTFRDDSGTLSDPSVVTFTFRDPAGTEQTYTYGGDEIVRASAGTYHVDLSLTAAGRWSWEWVASGTMEGVDVGSLTVTSADLGDAPAPRFASVSDLAALLARDFTSAQETQAALLLDLATAAIIQAVDKTDAWALALDPIPGQLRLLCLTAARRVMLNPNGARSQSEQLGSYQHTETFGEIAAGLDLTTSEKLTARRCVYGVNTASPRIGSIIDDCHVHEQYDGDLEPDSWWVGDCS